MDDVIGQRAFNKLDGGRQCTATSKQTGDRCKRAPIVGGFVCVHHGGRIPAVRASARERLLAMVDPALDALLRALRAAPPCPSCGRSDADRDPTVIRAAQIILDRTGFGPSATMDVRPVVTDLSALTRDELAARAEALVRSLRGDVTAEVVSPSSVEISATGIGDGSALAEPEKPREEVD